jgi:signal transduction histidine kinase
VVSAITGLLAAASIVVAFVHQKSATEPIGEGEVFVVDAATTDGIVKASSTPEVGARHARNHLAVEAVSLVDATGTITASTSATLTGEPLANPLLSFGVTNERFVALAVSSEQPIEIDGVVEWPMGSVLYQVLSPREDGEGFVLIHYDVSDLLGRRAQPGDIQTLTVQLLVLSGIFVVLGTAVFLGHSRAMRRHREMAVESELLRKHSRELEEANANLAEARQKAEQALDLAEEKMRIRSEFVLMINHELRTPLTTMITGAELMRTGQLDGKERREVLDSMVAHGRRLNEIIDQILAVARIENRGLAYELSAVPLEDIRAATNASLDPDAIEHREQIAVRTDIGTVGLIVSSLTENAHTHGASNVAVECGLAPRIESMLELGNRPVRAVFLTVSDDGPGIDPEFLPRAFEKFEKNSSGSGTGIGLYMVRVMVDALGGSIAVHTTPEGTTFQIALPAGVRERVMETV